MTHTAKQDVMHLVDNGNRVERPTPSAPDKKFYRLAVDQPNAFSEFKGLAFDLWITRMRESGQNIPDNVLATFVKEIMRVEIALRSAEPDTQRARAQQKLSVVRGLPPERQAALLAKAFVATGDHAHRDALIELVGAQETERLLEEATDGE